SAGDNIGLVDVDLPDSAFGDTEIVDLDALGAETDAAVIAAMPAPEAAAAPAPLPSDLVAYLDPVERDVLVRALERHRFNRTAAGASLGLSLRQMRYRMARLGVNVADHVGERGD